MTFDGDDDRAEIIRKEQKTMDVVTFVRERC